MLRRRSIRTKLNYALAVLVVIFCVLAGSSVWGVKRYRRLADSVHQQASEIPSANQLSRHADAMRRSWSRIKKLQSQQGMIQRSVLHDSDIHIENSSIETNLFNMGIVVDLYSKAVDQSSDRERILVAKSRQQQSLGNIAETRNAIDHQWGSQDLMTEEGAAQFTSLLSELVAQTNAHLDLIHGEMESFADDVNGQFKGWMGLIAFCMLFALMLVAVLWVSFQSLVAKPFRILLDGSRLVAAGQYGHRIDLGTTDELSELADAMNSMSTRFRDVYDRQQTANADLDRQVKERTREVIRSEQLASVGHLAAGVSHEINNPLASIAWSAEMLQSEVEDIVIADSGKLTLSDELSTSLQTNLRRIQDQAYRCKDITDRLLAFSQMGDRTRSSVDLAVVVRDVVELVGQVGKYRCKSLTVHCNEDVSAHVNSHEIRQVVLNLVTNAMESVDSDGSVEIHVKNRGDNAYVGVYDNGCGMTKEVQDHLFEPFFTRRRDGTGTGLGLSITYRIVSQHHGKLTASSDGEGKGSRMEMLLPIEPALQETTQQSQLVNGWGNDAKQVA